eukprot:CAMPEP_0201575724 /NCGR_PEP_ID=MMETSP0190_2-20130828/21102_1 /ASSEMBLY_ACC=CAM_ASM_000263 /TAXON_ID=37353 /ORGANISM="Rosalina sp." /LENGTH=378 /DNA_ID=CAMNT_0048005703 /DNA_START=127 /DNA_END=1266 /DNA_ORIENTATION=+
MGACCSDGVPKGNQTDQMASKAIEKEMRRAEANQPYEHRIILLGPGDSGKTTVLKQMRKIHGPKNKQNGNENEAIDAGFATIVRERIMNYMKILCTQSIKLGVDVEEKNNELRHFFASELSAPFGNHCNVENCEKIKTLWNDEGIKQTLKRRREYQIPDNVEYFMDERLDDIASNEYIVTFKDFLRIRMRTTGFMSEVFKKSINGAEHQFMFTDVGGQRSERGKWMTMMHDDIDAVLYVVAISEFDLFCFEDQKTPRLDEALKLFETILTNGFCNGKTVTLFFNKYDLFEQKLKDPTAKTIADIYPDDFPKDRDPRNCDHVVQYIYDKFLALYKEAEPASENNPHHHRTTALDTEQIELLMQDIEGDLIRARLIHVGF